jgi:hypothetical protein
MHCKTLVELIPPNYQTIAVDYFDVIYKANVIIDPYPISYQLAYVLALCLL